ncbi:MAG: MerR family transcriptional regulator [Deltaproteobacteria bacterium]|nr:MerR family transcriptional regulator [Deltaproteobacteria bacterium]
MAELFDASIPDRLFFKIGDVSKITGVKPYVLRYWESEFETLTPNKSKTNQRVYSQDDVKKVLLIKQLLHGERYSIEGAKKKLKELRAEKREIQRNSILNLQELQVLRNKVTHLLDFTDKNRK